MSTQRRTVESILAELARDSHGVVTRSEMLAAGISSAQINLASACPEPGPHSSRCFPGRPRRPEPRSPLPGRSEGLRRPLPPRRKSRCAPPRPPQSAHLHCRSSHRLAARPQGCGRPPRPANRPNRRNGLARHPGHHRPAHSRRPGRRALGAGAGSRRPRSRGPVSDPSQLGRGDPRPPPQLARSAEAPARPLGRHPGHAQPPGVHLHRRCSRRRPPASGDQPAGRQPSGRLPLARAPPDGRARQLPLPPHPPLLGAGPGARARGQGARR